MQPLVALLQRFIRARAGDRRRRPYGDTTPGFILAGAGQRGRTSSTRPMAAVHPRVRGADNRIRCRPLADVGPSPCLWGSLRPPSQYRLCERAVPVQRVRWVALQRRSLTASESCLAA